MLFIKYLFYKKIRKANSQKHKQMKKLSFIFTVLFLIISNVLKSNDGVFYVAGNQLIPIAETDISVAKEVLSITKISESWVEITVLYEFFNPNNAKNVLVGFEAYSPSGDVDGTPQNGQHPYIKDFTVMLNSKDLPYKVAIVKDSIYYANGYFKEFTEKEVTGEYFEPNYPDFYYVYYFDANFKKGKNILKHTYKFQLSSSVDFVYYIDYVLTAANRWANNQIDEFILKIDMGNFQDFYIQKSFFENDDEWEKPENGKINNDKTPYFLTDLGYFTHFIIKDGVIVFKKQNFHPKGELLVISVLDMSYSDTFDYKEDILPFAIKNSEYITQTSDATSMKILRNLPFARRGYIFKTPVIQSYYKKMDWYMPNKNYKATTESLTKNEIKWLSKISTLH